MLTQPIAHTPALAPETLGALDAQPGGRYIDATCGEGGHAQAILNAAQVGGAVLGIDADFEALTVATERLANFGDAFIPVNDNFRNIGKIARARNFAPAHGVLFDLGLSSLQLDMTARGFSFKRNAPLDMRFSAAQKLTAADIVNNYDQKQLARILFEFGEEPFANRIATALIKNRPLKTSLELAEIVLKTTRRRNWRTHPATRVFQALRIAVNDELNSLVEALEQTIALLGVGSRIAVISYHSLEDRIVKRFFRKQASECLCPPKLPLCACDHRPTLKPLTRAPITPSAAEVKFNHRSRSAKLRCAERI